MELLEPGAMLEPADLVAPGARAGAPIEIREALGELPHGVRYRAAQDDVGLLLTVVDPVLVADPGTHAALRRSLSAAKAFSHRCLLPIYAFGRPNEAFLILEHDPGGTSVRAFVEQRIRRGRPLDGEAAYALIAHVCNALGALHTDFVHGFVTVDTTHVTPGGRVFLSGVGLGSCLTKTRGFSRHRAAGRLPNITPEQLLSTPQLTPGTDVFGVATLFLEMVTGRPLAEAGEPPSGLGLEGPPDLLMCLERATAPAATARPPDMATFKSELADALRQGPLVRAGGPVVPMHRPQPAPLGSPAATQRPTAPAPPSSATQVPNIPAPPPAATQRPSTPAPPPPPPPASARPPVPPPRPRSSPLGPAASPPPAPSTPTPPAEPAPSASSSLLGLGLGDIEDAAARLSTLDGASADEVDGSAGPSTSGSYFGSFSDRGATRHATTPARTLDKADGAAFFVVAHGTSDLTGPFTRADLDAKADDGTLSLHDRVQDRRSGEEIPIRDLPRLRERIETRDERAELRQLASARAPVRNASPPKPIPRRPKDHRARNTGLLVFAILAAFGGVAYWLMQQGSAAP